MELGEQQRQEQCLQQKAMSEMDLATESCPDPTHVPCEDPCTVGASDRRTLRRQRRLTASQSVQDLMKVSLDAMEGSIKLIHAASDFASSMLASLPEIKRTPEEEREWGEIKAELDRQISEALEKSRQEDEARHAQFAIARDHARVMFAELPPGTCLSIPQVLQDYYARKALC